MKSRTIFAGALLASSLNAAPAAVTAAGPPGAGSGEVQRMGTAQQDMVRARDRVHDQSADTAPTADHVQTREQQRSRWCRAAG